MLVKRREKEMRLNIRLRVVACQESEKSCFARAWWMSEPKGGIRTEQTIGALQMPPLALSNLPVNIFENLRTDN